MSNSSLSDMTVEEFKCVVKDVVTETLIELLGDPDEGLELNDDIKTRLQNSISILNKSETAKSANVVAKDLGLDW